MRSCSWRTPFRRGRGESQAAASTAQGDQFHDPVGRLMRCHPLVIREDRRSSATSRYTDCRRQDVKLSPWAVDGGLHGFSPRSIRRTVFSKTRSHRRPEADCHVAPSMTGCRGCRPSRYIAIERDQQRQRQATAGISVSVAQPQEHEDHDHHQHERVTSVSCTPSRIHDRARSVVHQRHAHRTRQFRADHRSISRTALATSPRWTRWRFTAHHRAAGEP